MTWRQPLSVMAGLGQLLALVAVYAVSGLLGLELRPAGEHISLVWLPGGLALAVLFRFGLHLWPGVFIGALIVFVGLGVPTAGALAVAAGNTIGPVVAARLLHRYGFRRELDRRRDLRLFFLVATALQSAITASSGVLALWAAGLIDAAQGRFSWIYWWSGDVAGMLLVGVPLLSVNRIEWRHMMPRMRALWSLFAATTIVVVGSLPFWGYLPAGSTLSPLLFSPHLLLCWLAVNRGLFVSSFAVLSLSMIATISTALGQGPFSSADASQGLAMLWAYICTLAAMPMLVTTLVGELAANDRRWQLALDSSNIGVAEWDSRIDKITLSPRLMSLLGHRATTRSANTSDLWAKVHPEDKDVLMKALGSLRALEVKAGPVEFRMQSRGEQWQWFLAHAIVAERAADGQPQRLIATVREISEQRAAEDHRQLTAKLFQHLDEGLLIADERFQILDANPMFLHITGYLRHELVGRVPPLLALGDPNSVDESTLVQMRESLQVAGSWRGEVHTKHRNGEPRALQMTVSAVRGPQGHVRFHALSISDVTIAHQQVALLERQAHYDDLTGLPNRSRFAQMMSEAMLTSEREGFLLTICYMDLDHFKPVNDQYGHDAGDRLLVELADRLRRSMRNWASGSDAVARMGGDEFVLLLRTATLEEGRQAVERVLRSLSQPYMLGFGIPPVIVTSSIGATVYPLDRADADTLLRHADHAMYGAKQSGRNGYLFFDAEHDRRTEAQFEAIARVQDALDADQFVLHYQPKVNLRTGKVLGFEALLRWSHPVHGVIPPAQFLPLIEHTALSAKVGDWVMQKGIEQLAKWQGSGLDVTLSINVSARHLQEPLFTERLTALIDRQDVPIARCLILEVLETAALADIDHTGELMQRCQELGVRFALDDFGTGYSTLTYLKRLPFEMLKIDRSFVRNMLSDKQDMAIVEGIIGLSQTFGCSLVAEGVETLEQAQQLMVLGCEIGQGHGISLAMPADEVPAWVHNYRGVSLGLSAQAPEDAA